MQTYSNRISTHIYLQPTTTRNSVVQKLSRTTSAWVAEALTTAFSMFGIPREIIADNGAQFTGQPFQEMCKEWGITHRTSSPRYPRSNGQFERMVQTIKNLMQNCYYSSQDAKKSNLHLRSILWIHTCHLQQKCYSEEAYVPLFQTIKSPSCLRTASKTPGQVTGNEVPWKIIQAIAELDSRTEIKGTNSAAKRVHFAEENESGGQDECQAAQSSVKNSPDSPQLDQRNTNDYARDPSHGHITRYGQSVKEPGQYQ